MQQVDSQNLSDAKCEECLPLKIRDGEGYQSKKSRRRRRRWRRKREELGGFDGRRNNQRKKSIRIESMILNC